MRYYKRNSSGGTWEPSFTDDAFIKAVGIIGHGTPRQVSKLIGCSMALAQHKLKKLKSDGSIDGELIGNSWVYRKCEQ